MSWNVKKNDTVVILSGKDKGQKGQVIKVLKQKKSVLVAGLNKVKKHEKPSQKNQTGGITEKEAPINVSNVMVVGGKGEPTRVRRIREKGKPSKRLSVKDKSQID